MFALGFRFLAGERYHATPWDAHVNEGRVEWPPSPWRLLRAMVSGWHLRGGGELVPACEFQEIVEHLCERPPLYLLAARGVSAFHTRHYMPWEKTRGKLKGALVFDAFLDLHGARVPGWRSLAAGGHGEDGGDWHGVVAWPEVELADGWMEGLDRLLSRVQYLGRAESLAEVRVVAWRQGRLPWEPGVDARETHGVQVARPVSGRSGGLDARLLEPVRLLAPMSPGAYRAWRTRREAAREAMAGGGRRGRGRRARSGGAVLPPCLWDALHLDTEAWRSSGWSRPPGSRWVMYEVPRASSPPVRRRRGRSTAADGTPMLARFRVHGAVPPSLKDAVSSTDKLRRMFMGRSRGRDGLPSPLLAGKDVSGAPLDGHRHAFFLAEANEWPEARGVITHLCIYAPHGFDRRVHRALSGRWGPLWGRGGNDLRLVLLALGPPEVVAARNRRDIAHGRSPLFAASTTWVSRTPFVPTLHPKWFRSPGGGRLPRPAPSLVELGGGPGVVRVRCGEPGCACSGLDPANADPQPAHPQLGSAEHDLLRLLEVRGFPAPIRLERIQGTMLGGKPVRWLHFRRERGRGGGVRSTTRGFGFRLTFESPVAGPLAFGYAAHFGLGSFVPAWTGWGVDRILSR